MATEQRIIGVTLHPVICTRGSSRMLPRNTILRHFNGNVKLTLHGCMS